MTIQIGGSARGYQWIVAMSAAQQAWGRLNINVRPEYLCNAVLHRECPHMPLSRLTEVCPGLSESGPIWPRVSLNLVRAAWRAGGVSLNLAPAARLSQ